jgi:hypothetical protein
VKPSLSLCFLTLAFTSVLAQVGVLPTKHIKVKETRDTKFSVGDVWEYQTRRNEETSRVIIVRLDKSPDLGVIVHVAVEGIKLANCNNGPEPDNVPHMPFARKAFEDSVTRKVASNSELPSNWKDGYEDWSRAYAQNKAGIYVISVADAVAVAEKTFQHGNGCDRGKADLSGR